MKVVTCQQMREAEEAAFARGVSAAELMDDAGEGIAKALHKFFPNPGQVVLYLGKGNNAGDALVAGAHLFRIGWQVGVRMRHDPSQFKELPAEHWAKLKDQVTVLAEATDVMALDGPLVLLDALVGIGVTGPLRADLATLAREMNAVRAARHAPVVAIDIPSGLNSDSGEPLDPCVEADFTLTIAHPKAPLLADAATRVVGRLEIIPLHGLQHVVGDVHAEVLTPRGLAYRLPVRSFDFHKGQAGRVGVIAGSRGFLGAGDLCSRGALHGGAGLVTLYVKEDAFPLLSVRATPEVMVKCVNDYREVLRDPLDALAIGPGIGTQPASEILDLMSRAKCPLVIDADALNILALHGLEALQHIVVPCLLTPHPGEFARLAQHEPAWKSLSRRAAAEEFVRRFPKTSLLLKGSRTVIAARGKPVAFNTTGHPGMASGGMGDVLTGVCAALIGQGLCPYEAGCVGSWVDGRAAELALTYSGYSAESLSAMAVVEHLGQAFAELGN